MPANNNEWRIIMKKTILALLVTTVLSTNAFANKYETSLIASESTVVVALSVFAPAVAGGLFISVTTGGLTLWSVADETVRKQVQEIVNNDAQQFYNDGSITPALSNSINQLKNLDNSLTESDAVDMLVEAVNK